MEERIRGRKRRLLFLSAAACAFAGFLTAGYPAAPEEAAETEAAVSVSVSAMREAPATPLEMALRLERELARGAGVLMPDPDTPVRLDGGVIPLDGTPGGFPAGFLAGLAPEKVNGVEAWRATLRADDATGDMIFRNAGGKAFWSVEADASVYSADWVARLHSADSGYGDFFGTARILEELGGKTAGIKVPEEALYRAAWLATRQYFLPSHVELTFTFILKEDLDVYRSAATLTRAPTATVMSMSAPLTGLAVTGFAADTNGVALSVAWPTGTAIAGDALDIFFTRTLIPPAWTNLWRVAVEPAANALDIAIPRSELPPAPEAVPAACVTNIVPSAYDPGVMVTNIVCTNAVWLTDSGFFRLADLADTDGDGLTDACENWMYGTRADLTDTDGDTLDDGWEIRYGLDPFVQDDPSADTDDDGLTHAEECAAGTDPFNGDTDGDGLGDGTEVFASVARNAGASAFNVSGGAVLSASWTGGGLDYGVTNVALPFTVWSEGRALSNLSVNANGLIGLFSVSGGSGLGTGFDGNENMEEEPVKDGCPLAVAGFWDDLQLYPADLGSAVTLADVATNGSRFCVLEYRNVGFFGVAPTTNDTVSFQIVFEEGVSNKVWVYFQAARGRGEGVDATLGAQADRRTLQYACFSEGSAYGGLALTYLFGLGTDPLEKDSDGDGLEDGEEVNEWRTDPLVKDTDGDGLEDGGEVALGTSPTDTDTDGDGMDDGWEAENLLAPLDSADAYGDPDTDGLPNIAEFRAGTDPHVGDWDGDGSLDGAEAGWWETAAPLPWFDVSGGNVVQQNSNLDAALLFAAIPFPVRIGGAVCTTALLDVNGVAYFIDRLKLVESWLYSRDSNSILTNIQPLTDNHFAVAAHWDDLYARAAAPATRITVADVATNGARYCVIEYRDMGFYSNSAARVSFQIVIPENGTNTVCVRYADVVGANTGGAATLGAQGPGAAINIPVSFNRPFITNGLTLAYHFGSGGSPLVKDTDGDGLEDGAEAALGTSPANPDSDGDGLLDKWESENALDPLSASGDDGADGDPDEDGLLNRDEFEHDAAPHNADPDEDELTDLEETGGVTPADIPWFDLSGGVDLTPFFSNLDYSCLTVPLASPAVIRGIVFTNMTLDINGLAYLNPTGYQNTAYSINGGYDMSDGTVNEDALTLAPFWSDLIAVTNTAPVSQILYGTASDGTNQYRVIEYRNMRLDTWPVSTNNMVSFQLAIPTGATDRVFVRYALAAGTADGRDASVGLQGVGGAQKDSWCFGQAGRVRTGRSLAFVIGTGTDPHTADFDGDDLTDSEELALGTDPRKRDTDGDRFPDGWELDNGFNPLVNNDADGIAGNGAEDDPDDDGLSNFDEYLNGTDPNEPDSDWDDTDDSDEVGQGSDPNDPSDNGQSPPPDDILELPFHIYGDWAAWEMTVEGLGPGDTRVLKLSTDAPGGSATVVKKLKKGNSYRLTMNWLGSGQHTEPHWYCWEAQIDGLPAAQAYDNPDDVHSAVRVPGVAETVVGDGWFAQNPDGLLTTHVHSSGNGSGNVAGGLEAILYVPKIVTETVATQPADRTRKTIGVGEEVNLTLLPEGLGMVTWNITSGSGQLSHYYSTGSILFTAPGEASDTTVTATVSGGECEVDFDIIEPSEVFFENKGFANTIYNPGGVINASRFELSYQANVYLKPDTVNFGKLFLAESAADVDPDTPGWPEFIQEIRQHPHPANDSHPMTMTIVAGKGTLMEEPDNIGGYTPNGPFEPVIADWHIHWSYELGVTVKHIETVLQRFTVSVPTNPPSMNARFTVEKKASGITIGSGEQDAQWIGNEPE